LGDACNLVTPEWDKNEKDETQVNDPEIRIPTLRSLSSLNWKRWIVESGQFGKRKSERWTNEKTTQGGKDDQRKKDGESKNHVARSN